MMKRSFQQVKIAAAILALSAMPLQNSLADDFITEDNTNQEAPGSVFLGFGMGGSILAAGSANIGIESSGSIKQGNIDYLNKFGFLGLMEAGYIVSERLILDLNMGMKKHAPVNERTINQPFFNFTTFFANAQVILTVAKDANCRPYVGFGAALDYEKIDFSAMPGNDVYKDMKTNYDSSGGGDVVSLKGTAADDAHLSLLGSAGFMISAKDGFMFDVGYTGKYSITNAEFAIGKHFAHLSPVSHSFVAKARMYA